MVRKLYDPRVGDALFSSNVAFLELFFKENPEHINCYTPFAGGTWLHFAANESSLETLKFMVDVGFDVNKGDATENALPITSAARANKVDNAKFLYEAGSNLDDRGSSSLSNPLFSAVSGGSTELVAFFLDKGMDAFREYGEEKVTALIFAMIYGKYECAEILVQHMTGGDKAKEPRLIEKAKETIGMTTGSRRSF